jgi:xylulokinase
MRYTIGIDLGTSSVKAALLGEDGVVAATASHDYPILAPRPDWAEQDPDDWWDATCAALRAALTQAGAAPRDVAAVAVGGQMHGTVLLDEAGRLVRPAIIWPDGRAVAEAARAHSALEARGLVARLGGGVSPGFMLASLLWLRDHEPALWDQAPTALLPKDYLRYRLTGARGAEPSDGCGVPLVDLRTWDWSAEACDALGLPIRLFPPLAASAGVAGVIVHEAAAETGLRPGTPVLYGGGDQAMAALGAGLLAPGTLLISLSTGGQLITPLNSPLPDPAAGTRTLCHALPGVYLALSATLGAGLSLRWLRDTVLDERGPDADARVLALATAAEPGAGGLLFLPYLAGERAPLLDPAASGAMIGLRLDHGRTHIARAVLEGIAYSLRHALEPLQQAGVRPEHIILAGGLARAPLAQEIVAGVLGHPVALLRTAEQSALGAALLAAVGAGFYPDLATACRAVVAYGPPIEPRAADIARYEAAYAIYRALYPRLRDTMHALRRR